jgi:amino acid transporter
VFSYILMGTVISSVISSLGEMTALMPVNAPMMEFPRRFLDRGIGFAVGWIYWFAFAILAANQLVAVSNIVKFHYDDGIVLLNWKTGEEVDHAVWFSAFLICVIIFNMFPVRVFGELEYVFGCIKITFITMLILLLFVLDIMKPRAEARYDEPIGTKYWNKPYTFFAQTYYVRGQEGEIQNEIHGPVGTLLGLWTGFVNVMFSYVGMDIFAATAAESRALSDSESIKMAARKINIRIITLYAFAVLMASFVVPMDHEFLNGGGQSVGSRSVFIIAVVEAGMPAAAHFFNAMFVFSTITCAINSMYVASRVLHTLALRGQTGPDFITRRLRQCRSGVPIRTVLVTGALMLIGFMGRSGSPGARLDELANNCTVSCLIVYATICGTYLCFYRTLKDAQLYGNTSEVQAASYDRDNPSYPYKSHAQWLKAGYGLVSCIVLILFNGVAAFLEKPFGIRTFISAYISLPVFILLIVGYKIRHHGFRFSEWGFERSGDLSNVMQVHSEKRKGRLEFADHKVSMDNWMIFVRWFWTWLK